MWLRGCAWQVLLQSLQHVTSNGSIIHGDHIFILCIFQWFMQLKGNRLKGNLSLGLWSKSYHSRLLCKLYYCIPHFKSHGVHHLLRMGLSWIFLFIHYPGFGSYILFTDNKSYLIETVIMMEIMALLFIKTISFFLLISLFVNIKSSLWLPIKWLQWKKVV